MSTALNIVKKNVRKPLLAVFTYNKHKLAEYFNKYVSMRRMYDDVIATVCESRGKSVNNNNKK